MNKTSLVRAMAAALLLGGCGQSNDTPPEANLPEAVPPGRSLSTWSPDSSAPQQDPADRVVVRPKDTGEALVNPGMGWKMMFYSNLVENYGSKLEPSDTLDDWPGLSVVYLRVPWAFLEPEEGEFNWALLDTPAQRWIAKGKRSGEKINQPAVRRTGDPPKRDHVLLLDENLEIIAGRKSHLLPDRQWQHDLTFLGENSRHGEKILSRQVCDGKDDHDNRPLCCCVIVAARDSHSPGLGHSQRAADGIAF